MAEKRVAIVLGAGATLAQARHLQDAAHDGELPPLDTSFFQRVHELGVEVDDDLRSYAEALLGRDPFAASDGTPGMEAFFKDIFYDFISQKKRGSVATRRYASLVAVYRRVLLKTTNWVCRSGGGGPVSALLESAAESAQHVDVITFNHDLLVENVVAELDAAKGRWCLRHGYGDFASTRNFTSTSGVRMFPDLKVCRHPEPIRIYKLHGSLNWYVKSTAALPAARVLRGERQTDERIWITRRREVPSNLRRKGDEFSWPVLIPPIYAKQSFIENYMAPVWRDARAALESCDRVAFFGYSLPGLDIEAEKELQRALARNSNVTSVDVINPAAASASRYAEVFPRLSLRWHADIDRFLSHGHFS